MCLCPIDGLDVGVRLILWFLWMFVVETFDDICDIFEDVEVDDAVLVVPTKIKTQVAFPFPILVNGVTCFQQIYEMV